MQTYFTQEAQAINQDVSAFLIHFVRNVVSIEEVQITNENYFKGLIKKVHVVNSNMKSLPNAQNINVNVVYLLLTVCQWFARINPSLNYGQNDEYRFKKEISPAVQTKLTKI